MKTLRSHIKYCALLLGLVSLMLSGCATMESENQSARPWNTPHNWETGLPSGVLNQGR
jgi:hypothetical protein